MSYKLKVLSIIGPAQLFDEPQVVVVRKILAHHGYDHQQKRDPLWWGWPCKLTGYIELVRALDSSYTHVALFDARDVVVLAPPDVVMGRFFAFGHPWVFNAEPFIWSPGSFTPEQYPTPACQYRYLNSGASICEREHFLKWMGHWTDGFTKDPVCRRGDQDWYAERFIRHYPDAMMLDHDCKLFQTMCGSDAHTTVTPGAVHNNITDSDPILIHYNGGTSICLEADPRAPGQPNRRLLWEDMLNEPI